MHSRFQLSSWIKQKQKKQGRIVTLTQSLYENRFLPYLWFRLRYFTLNCLLTNTFHLVEFFVLLHFLVLRSAISVFLLRTFISVFESIWWSCLELLRTKVRYYISQQNRESISNEISYWLIISIILAAIIICSAIGMLFATALYKSSHLSIYMTFIMLQLAIQVVMQAYHAGVYALQRVRRPLFSLLIPKLIGICFFFTTWHFLSIKGLALGFLVSGSLSAFFTFYYCKKLYRFFEFKLFNKVNLHNFFHFLSKTLNAKLLLLVVSGIALDATSVITAGLLLFFGTSHHSLALALYLVMPLLRVSNSLPHLWYFDLSRLERSELQFFSRAFYKNLWYSLPVIGVITGVIATIELCIYAGATGFHIGLLLLPLLPLQLIIVFHQIKSFVSGYYYKLIVSGFCIIGIAFLTSHFIKNIPLLMISFVTTLSLVLHFTNKLKFPKVNLFDTSNQFIGFYRWAYLLLAQQQPVKVTLFVFSHADKQRQLYFLKTAFNHKTVLYKKACLLSQQQMLVFYSEAHGSEPIDYYHIAGGLLKLVKTTPALKNGKVAYKEAFEMSLFIKHKKTRDFLTKDELIKNIKTISPYTKIIRHDGPVISNKLECDQIYDTGSLEHPLDHFVARDVNLTLLKNDSASVTLLIPITKYTAKYSREWFYNCFYLNLLAIRK